jgi:hypothetical protein
LTNVQPQPQHHHPQSQQVPAQQYVAQPGTVIVQGQNPGAQAGSTIGITLIVVVVAFVGITILAGVLYVWANSLAEDAEASVDVDINIEIVYPSQTLCSPNSITIEPGEYYHCSFGLNGDVDLSISVDVGSGANVDIYTMTKSNFEKWNQGDSFDHISSLSRTDVRYSHMTGNLDGNQDYVVVVVNK